MTLTGVKKILQDFKQKENYIFTYFYILLLSLKIANVLVYRVLHELQKDPCFGEGSQASHVCPSDKSNT